MAEKAGLVVLVCGGRDFKDHNLVRKTLDQIHGETPIRLIVEGGAKGADRAAWFWAIQKEIQTRTFMANWVKFGPRAGPMRNKQMVIEAKPDLVIAFPGGDGTADMVKRAKKAGIEVREIV